MKEETVNVLVRAPKELYEKIKAIAGKEQRSYNRQILWFLREAVSKHRGCHASDRHTLLVENHEIHEQPHQGEK